MRRGFTIPEIILSLGVFVVAALVLLTTFSSSSRQSVQSRNRSLGILIASSVLDEVRAHPFGSPAPLEWSLGQPREESFEFFVDGKPQQMKFQVLLELGNGALVGNSTADSDQATVTVSWTEVDGVRQVQGQARVWRTYAQP